MKSLIVANWKMNPNNLTEAKHLFKSVEKGIKNIKNVETVICPSFVYLSYLSHLFYGRQNCAIKLGAQDCFWEEKGAFTGEVSPAMLKDLGCEYVIVGHSERRKYLEETDEMVNKKLKAILKEGLLPILCISKISQIKKKLKNISKKDFKKIKLAYEPISAIGTGKPYGIDRAKKINFSIKKIVNNIFTLYGGSVNSQNGKDYIEKSGFNGLLVGGVSLKAKEFVKLVRNAGRT